MVQIRAASARSQVGLALLDFWAELFPFVKTNAIHSAPLLGPTQEAMNFTDLHIHPLTHEMFTDLSLCTFSRCYNQITFLSHVLEGRQT